MEIYCHNFGGRRVQDQGTSRFNIWRGLLSASKMASSCFILQGNLLLSVSSVLLPCSILQYYFHSQVWNTHELTTSLKALMGNTIALGIRFHNMKSGGQFHTYSCVRNRSTEEQLEGREAHLTHGFRGSVCLFDPMYMGRMSWSGRGGRAAALLWTGSKSKERKVALTSLSPSPQ